MIKPTSNGIAAEYWENVQCEEGDAPGVNSVVKQLPQWRRCSRSASLLAIAPVCWCTLLDNQKFINTQVIFCFIKWFYKYKHQFTFVYKHRILLSVFFSVRNCNFLSQRYSTKNMVRKKAYTNLKVNKKRFYFKFKKYFTV